MRFFVFLNLFFSLLCFGQRPPMQGDPGFFIDEYWKPKKFKHIKNKKEIKS